MGIVLAYLCSAASVFCFYMLLRNNWVRDQRVKMIYRDMASFRNGPSYERMLWKFWVWDVKKFYPGLKGKA